MAECFSYNTLQNNGFTFTLERLPQTMFRVVQCNIPSVSLPPPGAGYPGASQYFPGTTAEYDELTMVFIVDEHLKNYEEIYRWITQQKSYVKPDEFTPKNMTEEKLVSDGSLITLTNSSNPNRIFSFKDMFPVSLGQLQFDTSVSEPSPVQCEVTFRYSYFTLK